MKRFYKDAAAQPHGGGFAVALDGKIVKTPGRAVLCLPGVALAEAVCAEWQAQGEEIDPQSMRLTRLANTAIDRVASMRNGVIGEISAFAASDLLCYRADAPPELAQRQSDVWQPVLEWAERRYRLHFEITSGVAPVEQPAATLRGIEAAVAAFDDFALAGLHAATACSGSVLVALALAEGRIDSDAAWACADLDDSWQAGRWGEDDEATIRRDNLRAEIIAAGRYLVLCREAA